MTQPTPHTERLADWHAELADHRVDRATRLVHNLALTGRDSRNGYRYAESALRAALPLYDHKPVFLDHAADRSRPQDRSTRDLVGTVLNPRFEDGRIRADVRVLDTDSGRTFLALADGDTPGVGMSHVVLARRSPDGQLVEYIEAVLSVDAVINPATTQTFRESIDPAPSEISNLKSQIPSPRSETDTIAASTESSDSSGSTPNSLSEISNSKSGIISAPQSEIENLQSQIATLAAERDRLLSSLRSLELHREQEVRSQRTDALLSQSALPAWAVTDSFRRSLLEAPDDTARTTLIHERLTLLTRAARHPPTSTDRTSDHSPTSIATFVAAIKRH